MKIVITKGQAVRILNEQSLMDDPEINQYAPNFERLVKLLRSPTLSDTLDATRTDGNDNTVTDV